jgi:signal transduction histidine kinase
MQGINLRSNQGLEGQPVEAERRHAEAVVESLATLRSDGNSLAELAHDARNMVTALGLYCDLLEEPGVLATQFAHYGNELRLVAAASRRLVEKLVSLDVRGTATRGTGIRGTGVRGNAGLSAAGPGRNTSLPSATHHAGQEVAAREANFEGMDAAETQAVQTLFSLGTSLGTSSGTAQGSLFEQAERWDLMPPELIANLAQDLLASRNLLSALAGPSIALSVDVEGGALPVRLNAEDLTRVMVNLVKNASEAMPSGGSVRVGLRKRNDPVGTGAEIAVEANQANQGSQITLQELSLTIDDSGPGIPCEALERIFEAGFTTRASGSSAEAPSAGSWSSAHRGLGLSISRSIVEAAGGRIYATNREVPGTPGRGARFEIVLPVRSR